MLYQTCALNAVLPTRMVTATFPFVRKTAQTPLARFTTTGECFQNFTKIHNIFCVSYYIYTLVSDHRIARLRVKIGPEVTYNSKIYLYDVL